MLPVIYNVPTNTIINILHKNRNKTQHNYCFYSIKYILPPLLLLNSTRHNLKYSVLAVLELREGGHKSGRDTGTHKMFDTEQIQGYIVQ